MQVGDLVRFESSFFDVQARDYANPGIIIKVHTHRVPGAFKARDVYTIMWADQKITNEHCSYIKPMTSS
jgi:hypothetical protein